LIADISEWASIALIEGFADDISATIIDDSPQKVIAKLEKASTNILKFMASNTLVANDSKTSFILFGSGTTGTPHTHIKVGNAMIKEQSTIKLLGLTITNDLKWTEHTEQVLNQMNHRLFLFKHIRDLLPEHTIPTVADALVTSHIRYAMQLFVTPRLSIYEPQTSISKKFQIVQNNVTRAWIKAKRIDKKNMKIARSDLRILSINQIAICSVLAETKKILDSNTIPWIKDILMERGTTSITTRSNTSNKLRSSQSNSQKNINGFINQAARLWNSIPEHLRVPTCTYSTFKRNVKKWLLSSNIP